MIYKTKRLLTQSLNFFSRHLTFVLITFVVGISIGIQLYIYYPRTIEFSYSGDNCVSKMIVAPDIHRHNEEQSFTLTMHDNVKLFGKNIATKRLCVTPRATPEKGMKTLKVAPYGVGLYGGDLQITTPEPPVLHLDKIASPLPIQEPLFIGMSERDNTHSYKLLIEDKGVECVSRDMGILCDIPSLLLEQGREYEMIVERSFGTASSIKLGTSIIETLSATSITKTSIEDSSVVYDKPNEIRFEADKAIREASVSIVALEGEIDTEIKNTTVVEDNEITIRISEELPRNTDFLVTVDNVVAIDSSTLHTPYTLRFSTSGGPKVKSVNIGTHRVSPSANVVVTLDQALEDSIDISRVVSVEGMSAQVRASENTIQFTLNNDLCQRFSIIVDGELTSEYGVAESVSWQYSSRTRCYTTSTVGYSVKGSAITAYSFGSGEPMLFIGAMHGDERSSGFLMDRFIDDLDANFDQIPEGRRVVVIPRINPDAFSAITRRNANNVDLNRNFPTEDWKSDVTMPGGTLIKGGGGSEPLSEPESKAIATYTTALNPKLVLTYHAVANNVIANEAGISSLAAKRYAELSGYELVPKSATSDVFTYDTNGAYEDWLYEKQGIAALLVELGSMSYSQFEKNKPAMWAMLNL